MWEYLVKLERATGYWGVFAHLWVVLKIIIGEIEHIRCKHLDHQAPPLLELQAREL